MALLLLLPAGAHAGKPAPDAGKAPEAPPAAEIREVVCGTVMDAVTRKPLPGATIAVRTRKGAVISWGKTDNAGHYQLDGQYVKQVKLPAYKDKDQSLLGQIGRGAANVWDMAAKGASSLVKPVTRAAASAVGGPVAGAVAGEVADAVVPRQDPAALELPDPNGAAVFVTKVVCPGYIDYQGPVQAYWMDPPAPDGERTLAFWLDPVGLAPREDGVKARSGPRAESMRLRDAALEPSIAPRGSEITLTVHLHVSPVAEGHVKVLARHDKSGETAVLEPVPDKPGLFRGKMKVGVGWPLNDQKVVILALRDGPASPEGPRSATPEALAEKLSLWRTRKLAFDPQILASRDREVLTLTVVE